MSFEVLVKEMEEEKTRWGCQTIVYGAVNVATRLSLIIASSIVAAEKSLTGSAGSFLVQWIPLLALAVAIIAALDTWLKPRDKWRGFMNDRDDLSDLLLRAKADNQDKIIEEFKQIRQQHRNKNVY
jgi:hypothetical protein